MGAARAAVTHVFTDLEGSSRLWEARPDAMARALARHDGMARETVARLGGRYVKTTGDGMHAVFDDPAAAIGAALQFQLALNALAAEVSLPLRARCGMHAGEAELRDADFFGSAVNRAARIMSAAHGGQVLVSHAVAAQARERLPDGCGLRELGRVRLRDLALPETVFQLEHAALPAAFPPLRSLDATPNNLPLQATSFLGRDRTLAELRDAIATRRLVTITGPGGIGKTRLALQLAAESLDAFPDGVWFVDLSASGASGVAAVVAQALGVVEDHATPLADAIAAFAAERTLLLVLDNCEHVVDAAAWVASRIAQRASDARVVATSREPLHVPGEAIHALDPLAVPDATRTPSPEAALASPAVALFVERARDRAAAFRLTPDSVERVVRLCRRLDGIPLAIELAAARLRSMSLEAIERRVEDRFRPLASGSRTAVARHRTLDAMVRWSFDLLADDERAIFRRLAVFAGGFSLDAAEHACDPGDDPAADVAGIVTQLCDKSLVAIAAMHDDGTPSRYRLLETIRSFAVAQLDAHPEDAAATRRRHATHYATLAQRIDEAPDTASRGALVERALLDHDNVRAAIDWCAGTPGEDGRAVAIVLAMSKFWHDRAMLPEARRWYARASALPAAADGTRARAQLLLEDATTLFRQGDLAAAREAAEAARAGFARLGDAIGIANALEARANAECEAGDIAAALASHQDAIARFRATGRHESAAKSLVNLANVHNLAGEGDAAMRVTREAVDAARAIGNRRIEAYCEGNLAVFCLESGDVAKAEAHARRARLLCAEVGDRHLDRMATGILSQVLVDTGDLDGALALQSELLDAFEAAGQLREVATLLDDVACVASARGEALDAARLAGAGQGLRTRIGVSTSPTERARLDRHMAPSRRLAGDAYAAAFAEGAGWSTEATIEQARSQLQRLAAARSSAGA